MLSPVDGNHQSAGNPPVWPHLSGQGRGYALTTLLGGDTQRADPFIDGEFATLYLSPRDYHRVHMPLTGTLRETVYIPGDLYSVNATTTAGVENLFARNERLVAIFDTALGPMRWCWWER